MTPSQWIHIVVILLGATATALAFLNYMAAAGVVTIFITAAGAIGAYVGAPSSPTQGATT